MAARQDRERPYVVLSCAVSLDGYMDDAGDERLLLSDAADFDRVDEVRAGCDAILVGATTIRRDNPRLLLRSPQRRAARAARGLPASPRKVTLTRGAGLDPGASFFTTGDVEKLVYCATPAVATARERLGPVATVVDAGDPVALPALLADLRTRGVGRLLVEGGSSVLSQLLAAGLADELHLAVAPLLVGDPAAPRFAGTGDYPQPLELVDTHQVGGMALLRYLAGEAARARATDRRWLREAIELSRRCPPSATAYSVGAVIVAAGGEVLATGHSRELDPHDHAEETALSRVTPGDPRLRQATLYSSLEPCATRASRPRGCADLIIAAGIPRVAFAWREPPLLAPGGGAAVLRAAGVDVTELPELSEPAREVNAHVLRDRHG